MYQIRHAEYADYEGIAAITTLVRPEPFSADEMRYQDKRLLDDPQWVFHRLVAVDDEGRVVGYGYAERVDWEPAGRWSVYAAAHPDHRGRGVGQALLLEAERIAREAGATELFSWCSGLEDNSLAWANRRGFALDRQRTESVLDLTKFDINRFAGAVDRVRESGLTLAMYEHRAVPEHLLRGMYELDRVASPDIPCWDAGENFPSWEQYRKDWLECEIPIVAALALDGDRVVGLSTVEFSPTPGKSAQVGFTAVLREYRGRSIALAVKLLTIEESLRRGAPRMRTNNDPDNPPMLAVNVKLGFEFIPGPRRLRKEV